MTGPVLLVVGTRPEAIKVAPVVRALRAPGSPLKACLLLTGQHEDLAGSALAEFGLAADRTLVLPPEARRSQAHLFAALLPRLAEVVDDVRPGAVLVQGDTASALAGGLVATWAHCPLVHLEAGLRSGDLAHPFPEEAYRRQLAAITALHLAPTCRAVANLRYEGIAASSIRHTGNTVVDAARQVGRTALAPRLAPLPGLRRVLVTVHRRESWGEPLARVLDAVVAVVERVRDVEVLVPVHPNPAVRGAVHDRLAGLDRVRLEDPLGYRDLIGVVATSSLILTDSGGIQEEAPAFGVPVLVLREVTERMEAVDSGWARLVGTDPTRIVAAAIAVLDGDVASPPASTANPFGDGHAAVRAVEAMAELLEVGDLPDAWRAAPPLAVGGPS